MVMDWLFFLGPKGDKLSPSLDMETENFSVGIIFFFSSEKGQTVSKMLEIILEVETRRKIDKFHIM